MPESVVSFFCFFCFVFGKKRKSEEVWPSKRSFLCVPPVMQIIDPPPRDEMANFCMAIGLFGQGTVQHGAYDGGVVGDND